MSIHTSDRSHAEIAMAAFEAGKHVYCEKPLAPRTKEVRAMVEAAERSGKVNFVVQVLRFNPFFAKVRGIGERGRYRGADLHRVRLAWGPEEVACPSGVELLRADSGRRGARCGPHKVARGRAEEGLPFPAT